MNCSSCQQDLPPTARFCSSCGTPCATTGTAGAGPAPAAPAGDERKPVTVLFCDLVGSTALSGVLDPETLRTVTLRYFEAMSAEIVARGGTPEKFIGDAVMAVFGVPVVRDDDARRALAAALGMRRALARLNEELDATLGIELTTRIGVNTGQVVAGSDTTARQALVSGETVNIAARLEQNAGPGEILIGPETLLAAGPTVRAEPTGPLRLKGKRDSVEAHRLLALGADDPELLRRFDVPFVGRDAERQALDAALERAARGDGAGLLRVTGEAGIGKTRLVREWLAPRSASGALVYGAGRCRSYGDHGTLAPLADAVRSLVAAGTAPTPGSGSGQPAGGHTSGPADGPADDAKDAVDGLAVDDAMALLSGGLLRDGTPNAPFEDMCAALTAVLERAALVRPVVLVLDDWHAAAPLLVRTVRRLADGSGCAGVLLLCAGRPDGPDDGDGPDEGDGPIGGDEPIGGAGQLQLTGLPPDEAARLAAGLAGPDGGPAPVDDRLLARAGGNPLYLEQLLVGDRADPAAASRPGEPAAEEDLPPTLQALLGARIGALARAERGVVDLAAVIGREFTAPELVRLELSVRAGEGHDAGQLAGATGAAGAAPEHRRYVEEALAVLGRRRLVESGPSEGREAAAYRFSSGLVHEVAYASLSKRAKAERHAWAAELPSVLRSGDGAVGGHLERAYRYRAELGLLDDPARRLRERAAAALGRAGAQAAARSDLHWAHGLLERAVDLCPGDPAATRRLGEVRVALGRSGEGAELLRRVRDSGADAVEAAHARLALAVLDPGGPGPGPAAVARAVLPVFEAAGDSTGRARAHLRLAQQFQRSGRHEEAERDQARALEHAVLAGAEPERAGALGAIGVSLWRGPVPVPAAVIRCRTLLAAHGAGRPTVRVTLNCPLAVLYALQSRPDEAYHCLAEAERLAGKLGFAEAEVFLPVFRATVEALLGNGTAALDLLGRADAAARRTGAAGMRTAVALDAARLELDAGREDRAAARLAGVGDTSGLSRADAVDLAGLRARLAVRDRPEEAAEHADRAVRASLLTDSPLVQATAELDRAQALAALGRWPEAGVSARSAGAHFTGKGHLPGVRRVSGFLANPPRSMATTRERS
ncbi:adenylate/guanylate cyclase domain-containing protein [Streptomyces sp. W4I9-2]|uniref:adenylate/guanylate cyclase domain-containing protein n=1 Tax=Streptomyces sp. W4I9-2 TaxID=3042297 RepID=UPI0027804220|nr:adenylate/guanylate cyclase domain-containing protein [Streptomyces sp. W4I9-2]MDQ0698554.1 class 3 adenylate cyclase/tetratricopeptide (TPR) repeat protein [Streptomyces sp. W4I9-2]